MIGPGGGILADDLSGALDAGAALRKSGVRTLVFWDEQGLSAAPRDAALVFDTESRNIEKARAAQRVRTAVAALKAAGFPLGYKKVDSTLRGHVGSELLAAIEAAAYPGALLCPALPAQGRTVENGRLLVKGVPLHQTEFGQDPLFTLHTSSVADILTQDAPITVSALSAGDAQAQVYIGDAQSNEALAYLAKVAFEKGWLPVGSAGLMAQCVRPQNPPAPCGACRGGNGHIAILSASPSALSQAQLRAPGRSLQLLQADQGALLSEEQAQRESQRLAAAAADALKTGDVAVDLTGPSKAEITALGLPATEIARRSSLILTVVRQIAPALFGASTLILFGGDTTRAALEAGGASGVELTGEAESQIPLSRVMGGRWDGQRIITKAGGFGGEALLCRLLARQELRK